MPTVRNARGADLYAASDDEARVLPIQSKALADKFAAPLGNNIEKLRSPWWIVTVNVLSDRPTCYILTLDEVKASAHRREKNGTVSYWLQTRSYAVAEYEEAWHRLGDPSAPFALPSIDAPASTF